MRYMKEHFRVFFSVLWLLSAGVFFTSGLVLLLTWGSYAEYFFWSLGLLAAATLGTLITSLDY